MKKQGLIYMLAVVLMSAFVVKSDPIDDLELGKRGATHKEDLPEVVFNSIKMNDFEMLQNFIPNEGELDYLKKDTPRNNRYIYENLNADQLKANTELNFKKVVDEGIQKGVNWSSVEIMDSGVTEGTHVDERIYKGMFTIQDPNGSPVKISFDIIKVKNKWFVFQGLRMEDETKKTSAR